MNFWRANKRKIFFLIVFLAVAGGAIYLFLAIRDGNGVKYDFYDVKKGVLERTVEAIGTLEPETTVDLSFQKSGTVADVLVDVGAVVSKGQVIAQLENSDETAALRQAQAGLAEATASLNIQLAKKPEEDVAIANADVDQAKADFEKVSVDYDNAKVTLANTKKTVDQQVKVAELDLENSKLNLDKVRSITSTAGSGNLTAVNSAKVALKDAMGQALSSASVGIQTVDKLYGIYGAEKFVESTDFYGEGGSLYAELRELLIAGYGDSGKMNVEYEALSADPTVADIRALADDMYPFLQAVKSNVSMSIRLLDYAFTRDGFMVSDLNAYRSELNAFATGFDVVLNSFSSARSSLDRAVLDLTGGDETLPLDVGSAELAVEQKLQALEKTKVDGETQIAEAENGVNTLRAQMDVQRALVSRAEASLNKVVRSPRDVDVAPYRARVSQASAQVSRAQGELNKTFLKSPMDGIISLCDVDAGEQVSSGGMSGEKVSFRVIDREKYHVDVDIPETQIDKIGKDSKVEMDFDAFENGDVFGGEIFSIEPGSTVLDGIVYYKVRAMVKEKDARMKPGMTANVRISAEPKKDALIVPEMAVLKLEGKKAVMVMNGNGEVKETEVRVGIKGDNGIIEIISGLEEGQKIIINWPQA